MELSKNELNYLLNAIDTHVRANGLNVAALGAVVAQKIQEASNKDAAKQPNDNSDKES